MTLRVGILAYREVEVLDLAGPHEVFSTASRVAVRRSPGEPAPFDVCLVAEDAGPVRARGGLSLLPDYTIVDHPPLDVLLVPGGVHEPQLERAGLIRWIAQQASAAQRVASVCTGAFLLARAGVLAGLEVTTHFEDCAHLQRGFPDLRVLEGVRWVERGRVLTSAGISAGLDMSLHLVARLAGPDLAERTARQMDYEWRGRRTETG